MTTNLDDYLVEAGEKVDLGNRQTITAPLYRSDKDYRDLLREASNA